MCPHAQTPDSAGYARGAPAVHQGAVLDPLAGLRALQAARAAQACAGAALPGSTTSTASASASVPTATYEDSRTSERRPFDAVESASEDSPASKKAKANNTIVSARSPRRPTGVACLADAFVESRGSHEDIP